MDVVVIAVPNEKGNSIRKQLEIDFLQPVSKALLYPICYAIPDRQNGAGAEIFNVDGRFL
ncbi:MAG: hypothetical protein V8S96_00740 [Lachnospiraceae bacterium]